MNYFKILTLLTIGMCIGIIGTYTVINNNDNDKLEKYRSIQTAIDIPREKAVEDKIPLDEKANTVMPQHSKN